MSFDSKNVHRLLVVAAERTKNLQRGISVFRTANGTPIHIYTYLQEEKPSVIVGVTRGNFYSDLMVEEDYRLYLDGNCKTCVVVHIKSTTGWGVHRLEESKEYKVEQVLARFPYDGWKWLCNQLDILADWLVDKSTVRVDPYHPERVLGDEETDVDRNLAANIAAVEDFRKKLRNTPFTPGIHVIE